MESTALICPVVEGYLLSRGPLGGKLPPEKSAIQAVRLAKMARIFFDIKPGSLGLITRLKLQLKRKSIH